MRGGVLLAEETPLSLMERCGCNDLEEAFLMLSHKQEDEGKNPVFFAELVKFSLQSLQPATRKKVILIFELRSRS